jgi:capsular exopolysaccharide synthesis family protein
MQEMLHSQEEPEIALLADTFTETTASTPALDIDGSVRDELTKLVQNLFRLPDSTGPRRVVFAGTESGTGCSWICAHVAEILAAQVNASVCVVDCNLRSPSLHQQFGVQNHHGLSDALLGSASVRHYAHRLSRANLWLLSCGAPVENRQPLLASDRMRLRLRELGAVFDYTLIDAAPLNLQNDASVLGGFCDGVILVLKANASRREIASKALQELQAAQVAILGAVLNQRTFPVPQAIYDRL